MATTTRKKKIVKLSRCNEDDLPKLRNVPISEVSQGVTNYNTSSGAEQDRIAKLWYREQRREIEKITKSQRAMYNRLLKFNRTKHQVLRDFWKRESEGIAKLRDQRKKDYLLSELTEALKQKERDMNDLSVKLRKPPLLPSLDWNDTNLIDQVGKENRPRKLEKEASVLVVNKDDLDKPNVMIVTAGGEEIDQAEVTGQDDAPPSETEVDRRIRNKIKADFGFSMMLKRHKIMQRHFGDPGEFERDFTMYKELPDGNLSRKRRGRPEQESFQMPSYKDQYLMDKQLKWQMGQNIKNNLRITEFCQKVTKNVAEKEKIAKASRRPPPPVKRMRTLRTFEATDRAKFEKAMELAELMRPPSDLDPDSVDALKYCRYLRDFSKENRTTDRLSNWSRRF